MCNVLHHHRFAGLWRCNQKGALAFTNGGNDVDDTAGQVFFTFDVAFELELLARKQRRQVFEHDLVSVVFRRAVVDFVQLVQRKVTLAIFWCTYFTFNHVACVQVEATNLAWADVDVVGAGGVT